MLRRWQPTYIEYLAWITDPMNSTLSIRIHAHVRTEIWRVGYRFFTWSTIHLQNRLIINSVGIGVREWVGGKRQHCGWIVGCQTQVSSARLYTACSAFWVESGVRGPVLGIRLHLTRTSTSVGRRGRIDGAGGIEAGAGQSAAGAREGGQ